MLHAGLVWLSLLSLAVVGMVSYYLELSSCCPILSRRKVGYTEMTAISLSSSVKTCSRKNHCVYQVWTAPLPAMLASFRNRRCAETERLMHPQIQQKSNLASCFYRPSAIRCSKPTPWLNSHWECRDVSPDAPPHYHIADYSVSCEGWSDSGDRSYLVANSCFVSVLVEDDRAHSGVGTAKDGLLYLACKLGII